MTGRRLPRRTAPSGPGLLARDPESSAETGWPGPCLPPRPRARCAAPLPAAALHAVRRRGCRLPPHRGYAPRPRIVQPAADPATALDDRGTPAMERTIEVEACVRGPGTRGAGHDRGHLRARRNLPQG